MKVTLGHPQHITLKATEDEDGTYYWHIDIALDSFCGGGVGTGFDTEQEAMDAGREQIHSLLQDHLDNSKQPISEKDQELILKFFES
jgi:hypothetical protein